MGSLGLIGELLPANGGFHHRPPDGLHDHGHTVDKVGFVVTPDFSTTAEAQRLARGRRHVARQPRSPAHMATARGEDDANRRPLLTRGTRHTADIIG